MPAGCVLVIMTMIIYIVAEYGMSELMSPSPVCLARNRTHQKQHTYNLLQYFHPIKYYWKNSSLNVIVHSGEMTDKEVGEGGRKKDEGLDIDWNANS